MRIALVVTDLSNTRIGGISRVATEIGAHFAELGHDVVAYVLARPGSERVETFRGVRLRYIEPFKTLNTDYPVIGFGRRAFARLLQDAAVERFDVVHSFNLNAVGAIRYADKLKQLHIPFYQTMKRSAWMSGRSSSSFSQHRHSKRWRRLFLRAFSPSCMSAVISDWRNG
jgi:hypothetical protein